MSQNKKSKPHTDLSGCNAKSENDSSGRKIFNIQLNNCQFGDNNRLISDVNKSTGQDRNKDDQERKNAVSKNHTGVLIIKSIFERHENQPLFYNELESEVSKYINSENLGSFRDATGWTLNDFLIRNKNEFDVFKRKQRKFVKMRLKDKRETSHFLPLTTEINDMPLHHCTVGDSNTPDTSQPDDTANTEDATWTKVTTKRKKYCRSPKTSESVLAAPVISTIDMAPGKHCAKESYEQFVSAHDNHSFRADLSDSVHAWVCNGESRDVIFVRSPEIYTKNRARFSQDVVSMWNTPHRSKSYIIIGVTTEKVFGVGEGFDCFKFSNMFKYSCFSSRPIFKTFMVPYQSKYLCLIEIENSCGHGSPSIVEKDVIGPEGITMRERELWYRKGSKNLVCMPNEMTEVFQWFLARLPTSESKNLVEKTSYTEQRKNAGTNTKGFSDSSSDEDFLCHSGDSFSFFWDSVKHFQRGHFVLIAGDISCERKYTEAFAEIPLIAVYDFDIHSYSDGLLNVVHDLIATKRHLSVGCWNEIPDNLSERGTRWCFMRGRQEMSNSRTDLKGGEIEDTNIWYKQVRQGIHDFSVKLANFAEDYTVPTILFLWPENEKLVPFMMKFVNCLNDLLTSTPNIVLCMNKQPETKTGRLKYQTLCDDLGSSVSICNLSYEQMCIGIKNHSANKEKDGFLYLLPKRGEFESPEISETDATWLREDFEVLFLNNPYGTLNIAEEEINSEISSFSKGGTLPWHVWYSLEAEKSVIDRGVRKVLEDKISKHLEDYKTSMITLCHAPGSGGTTLAQKTLWYFHSKTPCVHLKLRTASLLDELDRKVTFLHERTDLPVLLLIDGEEESKVRRLSRRLKYTVILYIKRYPYKIPPGSTPDDRVYLSGSVSATESRELTAKFGKQCGDNYKRKKLEEFTRDIEEKRSWHLMYEYGLTVYLHEFRGIVSYVEGYLELKNNPTQELTPAQKCLGFLSLVYYYGQTCVPCQFFTALFNKPPNYNITLEDFPPPIQEFVVYDKNEGKRNNIRICHYVIAKEILEQILSRTVDKAAERSDTLNTKACRNLSKFCMEFIEYASKKKTKVSALSTTVRFILTKTFIFRDERDMSDNEEQVRKRPVLSKLMIDIPGGKPLFTERLKVLKKLTESFPDDPNYCAHLGRFYAFCRPDEEHEAEKCFQRAMKICEDQVKGKREDDIDDGMKLTMMHIYHMYGIVKQRFISKYTGRSQKEKVVAFDEKQIFHEQIETLVPIAETACEYFTKSRDITPDNHDVYTYAYTGEIQTRLQICEFVNRHFNRGSVNNRMSEFLTSDADIRCKMFVQRSISVIEKLILECYMDVELMDNDLKSLRHYVLWYNSLFKKQVLIFAALTQGDGVSNRRLQIATKKLQFGKNSNVLSGVETIDDEKEIEEIVRLYEANFNDIDKYGFQDGDGKKELERDYRDWIFAIRHEKFKQSYSLEEVLSHVQNWNDKVRSPISMFYLFIVKSLLGFGNESAPGKTECLIEALDSKEHLIKMYNLVIRPKYPREWLGNDGAGIKRLKSGNRHVGIDAEDRDVASTRIDLETCKGTICRPNSNKVNGMITLDLGVNTAEVRVYFIPKKVRLDGIRFAEQRVEFNLAFSVQHGYEAYNVKLLKRYGCSKCGRKLEFTSLEPVLDCKCGALVYKDEINELRRTDQ